MRNFFLTVRGFGSFVRQAYDQYDCREVKDVSFDELVISMTIRGLKLIRVAELVISVTCKGFFSLDEFVNTVTFRGLKLSLLTNLWSESELQ